MTPREALILKMSARLGLDPSAVDAIGNVEGRNALHGGNSVGDHGTSFGPFQLHAGGALPAAVWARGATYANNWANSPTGIRYALQHMVASGAGGLHGQQAVQAISSKFERPADVAGEVSKAMGFYGGAPGVPAGAVGPLPGAGAATSTGLAGVNPMAAMLLQQISQGGQQNAGLALLDMAMQRKQSGAAQAVYGQPSSGQQIAAVQGPHGTKAGGFLLGSAPYKSGRIDQGHDFQTAPGAPIIAPGSGVVESVKSDPHGFGPSYPVVHFTSGPYAGKSLYLGHTLSALHPGQTFGAGTVLSHTGTTPIGNASLPGWAEIGYAHNGLPGSFGQHAPF